jgi:adenine-specific DNA-methyltransferase
MTNTKLKEQILEVLKTDDRIWTVGADDKKELNQTSLLSLVEEIDGNIIQLLLEDDNIRDKFFVKIKDVYVFKTNDFVFFMEENKVNNMYTQYKNRIGLTDSKRFLDDSKDVVLNWPFKDCILEGGQSTEEGMDNYFQWQETTMKDKLDDEGNKIKEGTKNVKEVDVEGHYEQKQAKRKEVFFNEVIASDEIDRLEEPKALVNWKRYTAKGVEEVTELKRDKETGTIKENLIIKGNNLLALHSLKKEFAGKVKLIYIDPPYNTDNDTFKYNDRYNHSTWLTFMKNRLEEAKILLSNDGSIYVNIDYNEVHYLKVLMDDIFGKNSFQREIIWRIGWLSGYKTIAKNYIRNHDTILFYTKSPDEFLFNKLYNTIDDFAEKFNTDNKKEIVKNLMSFGVNKNDAKKLADRFSKLGFPDKYPLEDTWNCSIYDKLNSIAVVSFSGEKVSKMLGVDEIKGQKSEALLKRIINTSTNVGDIVLDYHLGSGSTAAVAHKLNRQYIGVEQMDYIEDTAVARLSKVISGEKSGISKEVNWKGGGDFIYCELAKWNESAKEKINECTSLDKLIVLFDTLYDKYFLNYNLKIKEFREKVILEDNFKYLSLEEQKSMFLTMLDLNQMYVNESEMEDKKYDLSEDDIALTKKFYNKED